jgi:hypothetical protein
VPPPQAAPPVSLPGVRVNASDLVLTDSYWQGSGGRGDITITVRNTGTGLGSTEVTFTLPTGVRDAGSGCAAAGAGRHTCASSVAVGAVWRLRVPVTVDADAWRRAPLRGTATATATVAGNVGAVDRDSAGFAVVLPPGPPTASVALSVQDLSLPANATAGALSVRLANTGPVPANAVLELLTPDGVEVTGFPAECAGRERLTASRQRCDLGRVEPGQARALRFELTVSPAARSDAAGGTTLTGGVHAYATPVGQDTAATQAAYRIVLAAARPSASPSAGASQTAAPLEHKAAYPAGGGAPEPLSRTEILGRRLAVLPIVGTVVGLVVVVGAVVVLSIRRRLRDDPAPPVVE